MEKDQVLNIIAERVKSGSKPGRRRDEYKVGLTAQGGCMRGARLGGMLVASQALGLKDAFDGFYGDSAGPASMAYFLSDQTPEGTSIYYDFLPHNFLSWRRLTKGKPLVDIPWMAYEVMGKMVPLNEGKVSDSEALLHFYITSIEQGDVKLVDISRFQQRGDLLNAIHWSTRMPVIAGWPFEISPNKFYTDGWMMTGCAAILEALKDGCTHILTYLTVNEDEEIKGMLKERVIAKILDIKHPGSGKAFLNGFVYDAQSKLFIKKDPNIYPVYVKSLNTLSQIEMRRDVLIQEALKGFDAIIETFAPYNLPINSDIQVLR